MLIFWGVPPFLGCHFSVFPFRFSTQAVLLLKVILRFLEAVSAGKAEAHGQVGGKMGTFCLAGNLQFVDF